MEISNTEIVRRKITRGSVLSMLYISQSAPMAVAMIEMALLPENPQIGNEMVPVINFLADRGYINVMESDQASVAPMRNAMVRITDKGQDVVEGTTRDESIVFPRGGR